MSNLSEHRIGYAPQLAGPAVRPARRRVSLEIVSDVVQFVDFCTIPLAGWGAWYLYNTRIVGQAGPQDRYVLTTILGAILLVVSMRLSGGYRPQRLALLGWQLGRVASSWGASLAVLLTIAYLGKAAALYSRGWALGWTLSVLALLTLVRLGFAALLRQWSRQGRLARVVAVVGTGAAGEQVIEKLAAAAAGEIAIAGIFDDRRTRVPTGVGGHPIAGTTDQLIALARRQEIDEIIIALPLSATERIGQLVGKLRTLPTDLRLSIDPVAGDFPMNAIGQTAGVPVIEIVDRPLKHWRGVAKSVEDRLLAAVLLLLLAPLMAAVALAVRLDSPGPVLFRQQRYGFNNRPLRLCKFRTMRADAADPTGGRRTMRDDPRLTRVGRLLRSFSLDELPQLFNVVLGDMSLVGPRPHALGMQAGDRLYHDAVGEYFRRHRVRPGITGWAQINGSRGEIDSLESARRRVALDLYYIENWSLRLDLKILLKTLPVVMSRQGAY